jgi:capsular exopolysaccharide synthesis family protein
VAINLEREPLGGRRLGLAKAALQDPEISDAYNALFGDLRLARPLATGNSILVTSTAPDEGKTTVSLCLAVTASNAGQTVLLIDGDMRRSSLAAAIGNPSTPGLIEVLLGEAGADETIRPVAALADTPPPSGVVSFMPGGRRPATSLGGVDWSNARTSFRAIAQTFGMVFLDSPPVLAANDALLFAGIVDAVLLVVRAGTANLDEIRRVKEQLEATGTPILGAVLNRFERKLHGPSNLPYSDYYRRPRP